MKVALVYDRVNKWGGAERLLLALHELFPKAPLYTSVYNEEKASWAKVFTVKTSFLQKFPYATNSHELYAVIMPLAFESFCFDEFDLVISVTSEAAKGIITKSKTIHICYCLTPTRYLWSGYHEYFKNRLLRFFSFPAVWCLRKWDKAASKRPDVLIAISKEVQRRIKKYYGRDSKVVYPPVDISSMYHVSSIKYGNDIHNTKYILHNTSDYFLVVSRLVPYKRIDLAIKACNRLQLPLKIIGTGSEDKSLRSMAGPTVEFLGNLTDKELVGYYKNCRALLFAGNEDFGLVILEAQSFGKPVIAYKEGGALETIVEGKTGIFFYPQSSNALVLAIERFRKLRFNRDDCRMQAEKFSQSIFKTRFLKMVTETVEKNKKDI